MHLHNSVSESVRKFPENTAVSYDDGKNTQFKSYSLLWKNVKEISSILSSLQVTDTVAVILSQSIDVPAILLGILCNKCSYFPLTIDNGKKFVVDAIKKSRASWIIHTSHLKEALSFCVDEVNGKYIDSDKMRKFHLSVVQLESDLSQTEGTSYQSNHVDGCIAYCITTSGTTGHPKVIQVPHSCIVPNVMDLSKIFQINEKDTVLLTAPLTFDPSVVDIFLALSNGAKLLIVPDSVKKSPSQLFNILHSRQNVTVLQATASLIRTCSPQLLQQTILGPNSILRIFALGGEAFPGRSELNKWVHPLNKTRIYNLYGITEVSCWASCQLVNVHQVLETNDPVSIGNPLSGTMIRVDSGPESDKKCERGDIFIGSSERVCVLSDSDSNGTLQQRAAATRDGSIVWRNTGDIGKTLPDGRIVFVGREDDQIKRFGKRMTLSGLEAVCCRLLWVSHCCALVNEENQLILFYVTDKNTSEVSGSSTASKEDTGHETEEHILRAHIAHCLPSHYNPDTVFKLEAFPLTIHRKLDKKALLALKKSRVPNNGRFSESPVSWLSQIWMTVLPKGVNKIDLTDTFLSLGGDSLTAVNLVNRVEKELEDLVPRHFMDTLLNGTFGTCVELLQSSVKLDCRREGHDFITNLWNSDRPIERIKFHGKEQGCDSEQFQEKLGKLVGKGENSGSCDQTNTPSNSIDHKSIDSGLLTESHGRSLGCACMKEEAIGVCLFGVFSRGSRVVNVCSCRRENVLKQIDSKFKSELKQSSQGQKQQKLDVPEYQEDCVKNDTVTGSTGKKEVHKHFSNSSVAPLDTTSTVVDNTYCRRKRMKEIRKECPSDIDQLKGPLSLRDEETPTCSSNDFCRLHLSLKWTMDTKKCVDSSPVVAAFGPSEQLVFIGSHSGRFSAVDLDTGFISWTTMLPDRIESSACITRNMTHVVVGCYDGWIYVMDVLTGAVEWEFSTGSCVKCSPCLDEKSGQVICGSHDGWLYSLNVEKKASTWKHFLGGGSVYSSPVWDPKSNLVFAASLAGTLVALNSVTGCLEWCSDFEKPLFSSPCLHANSLLIGCVDGCLYCVDRTHGQVEWQFQTSGPVFSSPVSHGSLVLFGSHSKQLFCLTSDGQMLWTFQASSPIFSTPFIFPVLVTNSRDMPCQSRQLLSSDWRTTLAEPKGKVAKTETKGGESISRLISALSDSCSPQTEQLVNVHGNKAVHDELSMHHDSSSPDITEKSLVMFASTDGTLYILDSKKGQLVASMRFNGEVFSSPVFHDGKIVVGCRDNLLYCFDVFL